MKCNGCGREIESNINYCKYCGTKIEKTKLVINQSSGNYVDVSSKSALLTKKEQLVGKLNKNQAEKGPDKNFFTPKTITVTGIILTILLAVVLIVIILNNSTNKFFELIDAGNPSAAVELYNSKIKGDSEKEKKIKEIFEKRIANIKEDFNAEKMTYEDATLKIDKYSAIDIFSSDYQQTVVYLYNLNSSKTAYKKAVGYEKNKDYLNAIRQYSAVIKEDSNYGRAHKKAEQLKTAYKQEILNKLKALEAAGDYSSAAKVANDALSIFNGDPDLTAKKEAYHKKLQEIALAEKKKVYAGKEVDANGLLVTYKSASLTTRILPDSNNISFFYYGCTSDEIILDMVFTVKNTTSSNANISNIFSKVSVSYNNNSYTNFVCYYSESYYDVEPVFGWDKLHTQESATYHLTVTLPVEAKNSAYPITAQYTIDGEEQILYFR